MPHIQNYYEGSGAFDLTNENSISFEGSWANGIGSFPDDEVPVLISYDGSVMAVSGHQTWLSLENQTLPSIYDPGINDPLVDINTNGPEQSQNLTANKIIISVCSTLGLIMIAALVGFSFTKRSCSPEYINSTRTGTCPKAETQPSTTMYNTTSDMELTNIAITVGD